MVVKLSKQMKGLKYDYVLREKERVQELIDVNYKRERETYSKMFDKRASVTESIKNLAPTIPLKEYSSEEKELQADLAKIDKEVEDMVNVKKHDFSFEIKDDWRNFYLPECDDVDAIINNTIETYRILKKAGKFKEAEMMRQKIKETKYAKEHLKLVMNLDFKKPTAKMIKLAEDNNIDIESPAVLNEFRKLQQQNLTDIRLMKEGKKPPTEEELQAQMNKEREEEYARKMEEYEKRMKE